MTKRAVITFELSHPETFTLTASQWEAITSLMDDACMRYDIVEGDNPADPHIKFWTHYGGGIIYRHWIGADGEVGISEYVDWLNEDEA